MVLGVKIYPHTHKTVHRGFFSSIILGFLTAVIEFGDKVGRSVSATADGDKIMEV